MIIQHTETGEIFHAIHDPVPEETRDFYLAIERVLDIDGDTIKGDVFAYFVDDGELMARPACPVSITVDGAVVTLHDVPEGTKVFVHLSEQTIVELDDTTFEVDEPGSLKLVVEAPWPHLAGNYHVEIE